MKTLLLVFFSFCLSGFFVHDEEITITGKVTDPEGNPLIAVAVQEKGTTNGVITDFEGWFKISVKSKKSKLKFSYIGYKDHEETVGERTYVPVTMNSDNEILDEVVVVGFGKSNRKSRKTQNKTTPPSMMVEKEHDALYLPNGYHIKDQSDRVLNWNTEDYDYISENRFRKPMDEPLSTFSIDVDGASYSNMRRYLVNGQKPPADAVRIEELVNYFTYDYPQPEGQHPFSVITEVGDCPWNDQHRLVHIGLQGKEIPTEDLPPSNLVFLIDVSGSMNSSNKLPLLTSAFKMLVGELRPEDKVAMVVYAGAAGVVLQSTSGSEKEVIVSALDQLQAGGSTAGAQGIKLAYKIAKENFLKEGNNRVILATDGDFNVGVSSDAQMVRLIEGERDYGIFLTVLGFGMGNYKDNKMQKLADHGNGNHAYIDNIIEAKKVFVNEFGGTLFTIAKDVKIQVEFNPKAVAGYRLIGYENRLLNKEDFNDDKKDAGEIGSGHTVTALYEIIPSGINSEFLTDVDPLRYSKEEKNFKGKVSDELLYVKLRYKEPDGKTSKLIEHPVRNSKGSDSHTSDNFRWSAAVASFGMLLRDSEYKGESNYELVYNLGKNSVGMDRFGYRSEFLNLVESLAPQFNYEAQR